jgi:hypothetical protein
MKRNRNYKEEEKGGWGKVRVLKRDGERRGKRQNGGYDN